MSLQALVPQPRSSAKKAFVLAGFLALALFMGAAPALAQGATYEVRVTNLTLAQVFSPPVVVVHDPSISLFTPGEPASDPLAQLAEDGMTDPLVDALEGNPAVRGLAVAGGPIPPGQSLTISVDAEGGPALISVAGMLVQTNDGFFAGTLSTPVFRFRGLGVPNPLNSVHADAWDAGSEANTESCEHIPGPPCGSVGVRVTEGAEGFVFVHNGMHDLSDDLPAARYDWRSEVALITVERSR